MILLGHQMGFLILFVLSELLAGLFCRYLPLRLVVFGKLTIAR